MSNPPLPSSSSRLDSLSRRTTASAKPGLKFKPKVVARRSKEERDSDAPVIREQTVKKHTGPTKGSNRGRGGNRGGRVNRALAGTHVVSVGPLASGNALNESSQSSTALRSHSGSPAPDYLQNLVKRERDSRQGSVGLDSDEENNEDLVKINMNEEYQFPKEETELFPVRAFRDKSEESSSPSNAASSGGLGGDDDDNMNDTSPVKEEPLEKELKHILEQKDQQLQEKLNQLHLRTDLFSVDNDEALEEATRLNKDYRTLIKKIGEIDDSEEDFLFFQLPSILPDFEADYSSIESHDDAEETEVKKDNSEEKETKVKLEGNHVNNLEEEKHIEGKIGNLRIHKSGKLTLKIGNVEMDVGRGAETHFLQEVIMLDNTDEEQKAFLFGRVTEKLVATPKF